MFHYNFNYAFKMWDESHPSQGLETECGRKLSIALRGFVLPQLQPDLRGLTPKEFKAQWEQLDAKLLENAVEIFDQVTKEDVNSNKLSPDTIANYRSSLTLFMSWIEEQLWWGEIFPEPKSDVAPLRPKYVQKEALKRNSSYGIALKDLGDNVKEELEEFRKFRLTGGKSLRLARKEKLGRSNERSYSIPKITEINENTFKNDQDMILGFFGWYQKYFPENELSLLLLTDIGLIDNFAYWLVEERNTTYAHGANAIKTAIAVTKYFNYTNSNQRDWSDIPLILDLQDLQSEYSELYKKEKEARAQDRWKDKDLTHEEMRQVVQYLRQLCVSGYGKRDPKTGEFLRHGNRNLSTIIWSWQNYIVTKFFVYCPVRQEEFRYLSLGDTLFRKVNENGEPFYVVELEQHKCDNYYGERSYCIPSILTADFDFWINELRPSVVDAVQTLDKWLNFWGINDDKMRKLELRLQAAYDGEMPTKVQVSLDKYIEDLERKYNGWCNRYNVWETVKTNLESHNYLFFILARNKADAFGTPHSIRSIWQIVSNSIYQGTNALFDNPKWTNPHSFRHIAEKHIRLLNNSGDIDSFSNLLGHSTKMGDMYAEQIMTDYELSETLVDDWWLNT